MCDMDPDDAVTKIVGGLTSNSSRARCRHACRCGCHDGTLKHAMACTSCTSCSPRSGHTHYAIDRMQLNAHMRECHLEL